jgi:hypothetical protein
MLKNTNNIVYDKRLDDIQQNFEVHNFSKTMCKSIKSQIDIKEAIEVIITTSLQKDVTVQNAVKNIIDSHAVYNKGLWFARFLNIILTAAVAVLVYLLKKQ